MHVTLHLTARCNMRCDYCYAAPHAGGDMTFDTARKAVDIGMEYLAQEQPGQSLGVIFFGGEPLLMRGLIDQSLTYCKQIEQDTGQFFHYKITTNGLLLDEEFLTGDMTSDVFVALSFDGVEASHDLHRKDASGNGTFKRIEEAAKLLLTYKPYAPVMKVVTPETVPFYAESVRYLFDLGFRYLICSLDYGSTWTTRDLAVLRKQYKQIAKWYLEKTAAEEKFYFSPFEVKIASHVFPGSCKAERCELGKTQISVAPDGSLYPCVQFVDDASNADYRIGHVDTGIDDNRRTLIYDRNAAEKETCVDCAVRQRCNHYCGCLNKQATGSIETISPVQCAHERLIIPIADNLASKLYKRRSPMFIQKHYNDMFPLVSLVEDRTV